MDDEGKVRSLAGFYHDLLDALTNMAPTAIAILVVVLIGLVVAFIARQVVRWSVEKLGLDALAEKVGVARLLYALGSQSGFSTVAGKTAFWLVMLGTAHTVATLAGLPGLSEFFGAALGYLPKVFVSVGILVAGVVGADLLARLLRGVLSRREDIESPAFVARFVYYLIIVLSVTVAIDQLGLEIELVNSLILVVAGAFALGGALAVGLGARETVRNLIARFYVIRLYRIGDRVVVGENAGTIVAFSPTSVLVQHGADEISIPCHAFMTEAVSLHRVRSEDIASGAPQTEESAPD